jgi:hypothetical protein
MMIKKNRKLKRRNCLVCSKKKIKPERKYTDTVLVSYFSQFTALSLPILSEASNQIKSNQIEIEWNGINRKVVIRLLSHHSLFYYYYYYYYYYSVL